MSEERDDVKKDGEYEDICYLCRRTESRAGKMIHIPNNICICNDCMQKTFDSMNNTGFSNMGPYMDMMNMGANFNMPNNEMPANQKVKKKKKKKEEMPMLDVNNIPSPHIIKDNYDE